MLSLKNRSKPLFTKNRSGGFCRVLAVHGQTCQLVLCFSHSAGICGRKRRRRNKGHMSFRALIRQNPMFWVGKNTAVIIKLHFGHLIFQITALSAYLHLCFVLVAQTLSTLCTHFMGFNNEDIKQQWSSSAWITIEHQWLETCSLGIERVIQFISFPLSI